MKYIDKSKIILGAREKQKYRALGAREEQRYRAIDKRITSRVLELIELKYKEFEAKYQELESYVFSDSYDGKLGSPIGALEWCLLSRDYALDNLTFSYIYQAMWEEFAREGISLSPEEREEYLPNTHDMLEKEKARPRKHESGNLYSYYDDERWE